MKAIKYEGIIDVSGYSDYLHQIKDLLPPGALTFAEDINHYNFYSNYCTHDLRFNRISIINSLPKLS